MALSSDLCPWDSLSFRRRDAVSAQVTAPPPDAAEIPLSKIPACTARPNWKTSRNRRAKPELTVSDFRQNIPGDGTPAVGVHTA